jgi:hypothetical protein
VADGVPNASTCPFVAGAHIPYRDSKLTRILQPSLGGNSKTIIICNMTPAAIHVEESHSTLRFATRAKTIVNKAVVNNVMSEAAVMKRQAREIEQLRKQLSANGYDLQPLQRDSLQASHSQHMRLAGKETAGARSASSGPTCCVLSSRWS